MFPLRDDVPRRSIAIVNAAIILINAYVFYVELQHARHLEPFIQRYGLVPAVWTSARAAAHLGALDKGGQLLTSMFLHGGWLHILSNMWCLYIFGSGVESGLGHARYLAFYLTAGVFAGLVQLFSHWGSPVPTVGASGAIAGVMGGYFLLYPKAKIEALIPIFIIPVRAEVSAFVFLLIWFLTQLYSGLYGMGPGVDGIAWWAHVGGFLAGMYWVRSLRPKRKA